MPSAQPTIFARPEATPLDALGNSVRREILDCLATRPHAVGELAKRFPVSRPAISKHLRLLEEAGLIRHDKVGARNLYRLEARGFEAAHHWLDSFWSEALTRFRLVAENTQNQSPSEDQADE